MQLKSMAVVALASGVVSSAMAADAVQWRVQDGGNGHWYEAVVLQGGGLNWQAARLIAQAQGGDLASLEISAERSFVAPLVNFSQFSGAWIGLFQSPATCEPGCDWTWVSGATLSDQNWAVGEPNNLGGSYGEEDHALMAGVGWGCGPACWGEWVDWPGTGTLKAPVALVEWSADCNSDGIVDYGQCRDGSLPDYNANNIPDCCEQGAACIVGNYPVQWHSGNGGNGHWYQVVLEPAGLAWSVARERAVASGGHLATITSQSEDELVFGLAGRIDAAWSGPYSLGPWLGGSQQDGAAEPAEGWSWVTGEPWNYRPPSSWNSGRGLSSCGGNADNGGGGATESSLHYISRFTCWNDAKPTGDYFGDGRVTSSIIEWSADCNADGIVDYGQILRGELADTNANGVPDTCESTLLVPSQFPTIQAAIDSVPAGAQRTVQVAAGTYNESFSLNGKNVVIRGAANNATILDGTGLTTSIAKFTGGEPASAGVEQLVFRNGTAGSRLTPKSPFTVGGAIYANATAAHITNCRFENCRADFGGAVYQYVGTLAWDDCVFANNIANAEGGAVLVYNCTGVVRGSSFTGNRSGLIGPGSGSAFKSVGSNGEGETIVLDSCTITGNIAGDSGSAVEHYEHTEYHPGVLRIVNTAISGNTSGQPTPVGAAGLRVLGRMQSCVLASGTSICNNTPQDVDGPYFIEGSATVCGCLADITGDGVVNGGDLGVLLANWGVTAPSGLADVTHDGVVDGGDLSAVLSSWGVCN